MRRTLADTFLAVIQRSRDSVGDVGVVVGKFGTESVDYSHQDVKALSLGLNTFVLSHASDNTIRGRDQIVANDGGELIGNLRDQVLEADGVDVKHGLVVGANQLHQTMTNGVDLGRVDLLYQDSQAANSNSLDVVRRVI